MERDPVVHVVRAPENLDASTVPVFGRRLEEIPEGAAVDVDLAGVEFIDSSGLRLLLMETARREGAGARVRLLHPAHQVERILELCGLEDRLDIVR